MVQDLNTATTPPPRRMIIHCGVQKTASTSLHHFLQRNRAALADHLQILTPVKGSLTRKIGRTAMQFSLDPSVEMENQLTRHIRTLRDELVSGAMVSSTTVLLSHENLPGAMLGNGGVTTLYPQLERIIQLLNSNLAPFVPDFVFYSREMSSWKQSVYGQAVKSDRYAQSREVFLETTKECGTWVGLKQRLLDLLGPDRIRMFRLEDEPESNRPGRQLLQFTGLSEGALSGLEPLANRANRAQNTGALEFMRLVNTLGLDRPVRAQIVDLISRNQQVFLQGTAQPDGQSDTCTPSAIGAGGSQ